MTIVTTYSYTLKITMDSEPKLGVLGVKVGQALQDNAIKDNIIVATITSTVFTVEE